MRIVAGVRQSIYLSRGRVFLRRLGMRRALSLITVVRSLPNTFRDAPLPASVSVPLNGFTSRFLVSSRDELHRTLTLGGEGRFLNRLIQELRPGEVVYDIGTNLGLYAIFLAQAVGPRGRVIGFEPELRSFERFQENLRLNALPNVRVFDCALGNEDREIVLAVDESAASGVHHILGTRDGQIPTRWQSAKMVVGDRFIDMESLPVPNVLKIDVEGMEEEVLLGLAQTLQRPACRLIFCEVHFAILDQRGRWDAPRRILRFLENCGFNSIEWLNYGHLMATKTRVMRQPQAC